jgi:hypothetical protein
LLLYAQQTERNSFGLTVPTISRIVKQFKGSVTKQIGKPVWQKSFYDHTIRNQQDYDEVWQYIDSSPSKYALKKHDKGAENEQ